MGTEPCTSVSSQPALRAALALSLSTSLHMGHFGFVCTTAELLDVLSGSQIVSVTVAITYRTMGSCEAGESGGYRPGSVARLPGSNPSFGPL